MESRYKFLENPFDKNNSLEEEYIHYRSVIEYKLNNGEIPYLDWWIIFFQRKLKKMGIDYRRDVDILPYVLEYIWELIKEKKVKVNKIGIEEYDEPRKEKVKVGIDPDTWEDIIKEVEVRFRRIDEWVLDPCEIEDEKELERKVEEWKSKTYELYKYLLKKYGNDAAEYLLYILEIRRTTCYEWEIRIE